jgi:hypothetical protein
LAGEQCWGGAELRGTQNMGVKKKIYKRWDDRSGAL